MSVSSKNTLGSYGEKISASYLTSKGFVILDHNYRMRYGEIDLIAMDKETLVFVEVKTRKGDTYGMPEESLTSRKRRLIEKGVAFYLLKHPKFSGNYRIDAVCVYLSDNQKIPQITHYRNISS